jgi:SAM-dependent methyltransferase
VTTAATHETWAREFTRTALAHWTPARTAALVGGKDLPITPRDAPLLLRAIGLLHRDAAMPPTQHRKFLQINHLARQFAPALRELAAAARPLRVLDAGCGRSYLSLLLAWCARHRWQLDLEILGVDRNAAVIEECRRRAELAGLADAIRFEAAPLDAVRAERAHVVIALHACDTATCDAIALGVSLGAELIAVAPCCHAELARRWAALARSGTAGPLAPIWNAPHLRRETAAHITDAMRAALLRAAGYAVTATEFVGAEHTAKNTLLYARRGAPDPAARDEYDALVAATGACGLDLAGRV